MLCDVAAKTQEEVHVSKVPNDHVVNGSDTYVDVELAVDVVRIEEHVVEQVRVDEVVDGSGEEVVVHGIGEKAVKYGNGHEVVEETSGEQVEYDVDGIDSADVGIDDDDDFLVDEENKIDVPFENIGVASLVPKDILEGEDVDVVNANEQIFNQIRVNSDIPVKAVQDQLQRYLDIQVSMSKTFRAKAKAEREVKGDHTLEYDMLKYYVVELQSTNLNTTIKIVVERNIDPSLPTSVLKIIYVCLRALKMGFMACKREMLGLDGAFMKGPFSIQVLTAIGLDSKNGIYPLAYALVEAEIVVDAFIPYKKSKAGKRFAFVRFIKVDNIDRLVTNLCTIWIGCFHLHANVARFHRESKPSAPSHTSNANERNSPCSYVSILKSSKTSNVMSDQVLPSLILDDSDERIIFSLEGLPLKVWTRNTFAKVASKWGDLVEWEDLAEKSLFHKHLCVKTKLNEIIAERFKIISSDDEEDVEDDGSQSGDKVTSDNDVERETKMKSMKLVTMKMFWGNSSFDYDFSSSLGNSGVFSTCMAFGGNIRDLGSFGEETNKILTLHNHEELCIQRVETTSPS
ncbi:hypothetical protein Tco_0339225 [Tanacetum coccineum]